MTNMCNKISVVHSFMDWRGGAERVACDFACNLSEQGFTVEFVTGKMLDFWKKKFVNSTNQISIKELGKSSRGPLFWMFANRYANGLKNLISKDSQVLMPLSFPSTLAAVRIKDELSIPCIWYCHEPPRVIYETSNLNRPFSHKFFFKIIGDMYRELDIYHVNKFDRIVANSNFTARRIKEIYGFNEKKIDVVYPGINIEVNNEDLSIPTFIRKAKLRGDNIIFCPCALNFHKNFQNIIYALKLLNKIQFKAIFIKGRSEVNRYFLKKIKELGIEDKVIYLNFLPDEDMRRYYFSSDLVIYVPIDEPFGLVALEALSNKKPIVVSNSGGISEIIEDDINGLKVNPKSPMQLKEAVEKMLLDPEKSKSMGEAGYDLVKTKFNVNSSVKKLTKIIKKQLC